MSVSMKRSFNYNANADQVWELRNLVLLPSPLPADISGRFSPEVARLVLNELIPQQMEREFKQGMDEAWRRDPARESSYARDAHTVREHYDETRKKVEDAKAAFGIASAPARTSAPAAPAPDYGAPANDGGMA